MKMERQRMRMAWRSLVLLFSACGIMTSFAYPSPSKEVALQEVRPPKITLPGAGGKQPMENPKSAEQLVTVRGVADVDRLVPGQAFHLAFIFTIEPGWHIYWLNSGASGGPTEIKVSGPQGFTFGKALFPRPIVLHGEEGDTYGYERQTVLFVPV
jgi:DsbC/DsbD-like thiol-disulfide interchange protein